jgi:hypothetical protein
LHFPEESIIFWQFNTNITHQINEHEIKFGAEFKIHELRQYAIGPLGLAILPDSLKAIIQNNPDLLDSAQQSYIYTQYQTRGVNTYGYDYFGREFDGKSYDKTRRSEGPKKPMFGSLFLQDKMELQDFVLNFGLRFDYWDSNTDVFKDLYDLTNSKNTQLWTTKENFKAKNPIL